MQTGRNLTDADVEAIVDKLKTELVADFYGEVGRGVWAWIKRGVWTALLALALYGIVAGRAPGEAFDHLGR